MLGCSWCHVLGKVILVLTKDAQLAENECILLDRTRSVRVMD